MAPPYSSGSPSSSSYSSSSKYRQPYYSSSSDSTSLVEDLRAAIAHGIRWSWHFWNERGRHMALAALVSSARRLRQNLTYRRIFSFPHLLVAIWVVVLLWGERWVFHSKVESCNWSNWESWPAGADPHHLVLVADPQLIDPHSYPGRPWPVNDLTVLVTDNYLRRSYNQLVSQLSPDTIFFLGDLFDGGREWKTAHGDFRDPEWGPHPKGEQKYIKKWNRKYGEFYWLREYARFGNIFLDPWVAASERTGAEQKRRKLIASLPGNHDLGFGADIKIPVRDRFEAYFGEGNRVDVVGNHTFVSVDTVSMSAGSSEEAHRHNLQGVYKPTEHFLLDVKWRKRRMVEKELRFQRGEVPELKHNHRIENLDRANFKDRPRPGEGVPDLPTILLTHVPLYRPPGTPCGPMREHWPPTKPPPGQTEPVVPDHRNAISVSRGYQYQNVLSETDSVMLVEKIGNVVHAFSGDDHDYCEVVHAENQHNVREITVKSTSMAMGVPTPGFLMVSMYNPLDANGNPLAGSDGKPTLQTHLCLLPQQLSTYLRYVGFGLFCIVLLTIRAFLVPMLKLQRFALEPELYGSGFILPVFKAKVEDYDEYGMPAGSPAGFSASRYKGGSGTRDRSGSLVGSGGVRSNGLAALARNASPKASGKRGHHHHNHSAKGSSLGAGKWGWGGAHSRGPKIEIFGDNEEDMYKYNGGKWKAASSSTRSSRSTVNVVVTELWTTVFRVAWMVLLFFGWLAYKG
ncbi:calcineurin-like phosphoesterase-domain-containing protein [Apodospora peruviana]|uniref:Calcineurin-like phosphoesterase-domain-containing protein n=1 Tax=Apodospora peruviana TaxID=516989 RepID=A0AAE0ISG6_9PEZI|nr:calcineurin-like phosphoesterase-domain-containing protein [Apodospora peruviana]